MLQIATGCGGHRGAVGVASIARCIIPPKFQNTFVDMVRNVCHKSHLPLQAFQFQNFLTVRLSRLNPYPRTIDIVNTQANLLLWVKGGGFDLRVQGLK